LEPALPLHLPQPDEPRVARVCRGILREPGAARGLAEWAAELGYDSPSAFAAMFRRAVGEPPSAFAARRE
ncbi:helix-turn-helix domain-containing protein, partial [Bordetella pertussis]|uniref:helix-turn-helix domain-containing protein n=1 Tax=Bordetella pertussis TaxID=520 RepID=UPI000AE9FBDB